MSATKKRKLSMKVHQVDGSGWVQILWPVKYFINVDANLNSLTCKLLQENEIKSDHRNNIMVQFSNGGIILDCWIKICDGWVAEVKFLWETGHKRTQLAKTSTRKDITGLHIKLGHPSEVITIATGKSIGINLSYI